MKDLKIYCISHNDVAVRQKLNFNYYEIYTNNICSNSLNEFNDKAYAEMYAIFDIFFNKKYIDYKYIGFCHYRRFFDVNEKQIIKDLNTKYKICLVNPNTNEFYEPKLSIYEQFSVSHNNGKDNILNAIRNIIKDIYPNYLNAYDYYINLPFNYCFYGYNMFICNKKIFEKYCNFVFPIIEIFKLKNNINSYKRYEEYVYINTIICNSLFDKEVKCYKLFAYIIERLLGVFVYKNFKTNEIKLYNIKIYN